MTTRRLLWWALAALMIFAAQPSFSKAELEAAPEITGFIGETTPGAMTQMELAWIYTGHDTTGLYFLLYRLVSPGDSQLVAQIPGTERHHKTAGDPTVLSMNFRIVAMQGGVPVAWAVTSAPVAHHGVIGSLRGSDTPHDAGGEIDLEWAPSPDPQPFSLFKIYRTAPGEGAWKHVGTVEGEIFTFTDQATSDKTPYSYMIRGYKAGTIFESDAAMNIISEASWFDWRKINLLVIAVIVLSAIVYYVLMSGRMGLLYIRKIAGLQAVEEAVGRATEMGRSVLFIPGIQDLDDVQTIAGLTILGSVSKMTAAYETKLDVPVSRSLVMSNGREVVKQSYMSVGRPDFYNDDIVHYVTDEQFGYVAAIDGIMVREKPAACFYMGAFFAESLILAETGNHVGAIQIAGTAMPTQLPFFVAACDYTLIGEELFAASAYLSKDQAAIAALRGQDVGKLMAMASIIIGVGLTTVAGLTGGSGLIAELSTAWIRLFALNF